MAKKVMLHCAAAQETKQQLRAAQQALYNSMQQLQSVQGALDGLAYASLPDVGQARAAALQTLQKLEDFESALQRYQQTIEQFDYEAAGLLNRLPHTTRWAGHTGWHANAAALLPGALEKLKLRGTAVPQQVLLRRLLALYAPGMGLYLAQNPGLAANFTALNTTAVMDPATGVTLADIATWLLALIATDGPLPIGDVLAGIGILLLGLLVLFRVVKVVDGFVVAGNTPPEALAPPSGLTITPAIAATTVDNLPEAQRTHVMKPGHLWEKVTSGGPEDPDDWWQQIKAIIKKVLAEGVESVYKSDKDGTIYKKTLGIAGEIVTVTYKVLDGIVHLGDAWVNKPK